MFSARSILNSIHDALDMLFSIFKIVNREDSIASFTALDAQSAIEGIEQNEG